MSDNSPNAKESSLGLYMVIITAIMTFYFWATGSMIEKVEKKLDAVLQKIAEK